MFFLVILSLSHVDSPNRIIWLLTKYGEPEPWTQQQVSDYLAKLSHDLDAGYHVYYKARRVWAQKPYDSEPKTS